MIADYLMYNNSHNEIRNQLKSCFWGVILNIKLRPKDMI